MSIWFHIILVAFVLYKFKKYSIRPDFTGKHVWITGGSSGIGEALAVEFVRLGAFVIVSGRNLKELERVKSSMGELAGMVTVFQLDLSDAEAAFLDAKTFLTTHKVDILVNNAGRSQRGGFLDDLSSLKVERALMELNYFSVVAMTKAIFHSLNENSQIVVIDSMAGVIGSPYRTSYSASKFAVTQFFQSLMCENKNPAVTLIYPGYVNTNLSKNAMDPTGKSFGKVVENSKNGMLPRDFAKIAVKSIYLKEPHVFICDFKQKVILFLRFWLPGLASWVLYKYGKKVKKDMDSAS